MIIRPASIADFAELYEIGKNTPELKVSATEDFMEPDEFQWTITNPNGVFLVAAENNQIVGFIYANTKDLDRPMEHQYACLVYLVVIPAYRKRGIARQLYSECEKSLKTLKITHLYSWASLDDNSGIISFMKKQGFAEGHQYVWMDKIIA